MPTLVILLDFQMWMPGSSRFFNRLMAEDADYFYISIQFTRPRSLLLSRSLEFVQHPPAPPGGLDWRPMKRNINKTFLVLYFSREEEHIIVFV